MTIPAVTLIIATESVRVAQVDVLIKPTGRVRPRTVIDALWVLPLRHRYRRKTVCVCDPLVVATRLVFEKSTYNLVKLGTDYPVKSATKTSALTGPA